MQNHLERFAPDGATRIVKGKIEAFIFTNAKGKPVLKAYYGRAKKPAINCYYFSEEARNTALDNFIADREACEKIKQEKREREKEAKARAAKTVKIGDIFRAVWGYEQTNVDYYQVVSKKGQTIEVQEIEKNVEFSTDMTGSCTPKKNALIGNKIKKRLNGYENSIYFRVSSYCTANLIYPDSSGEYPRDFWTSYA